MEVSGRKCEIITLPCSGDKVYIPKSLKGKELRAIEELQKSGSPSSLDLLEVMILKAKREDEEIVVNAEYLDNLDLDDIMAMSEAVEAAQSSVTATSEAKKK
jgi:hypothetical protein